VRLSIGWKLDICSAVSSESHTLTFVSCNPARINASEIGAKPFELQNSLELLFGLTHRLRCLVDAAFRNCEDGYAHN